MASPLWLSPPQAANELAVQFQCTLAELPHKQIRFRTRKVLEHLPLLFLKRGTTEVSLRVGDTSVFSCARVLDLRNNGNLNKTSLICEISIFN